MTDIIINGTSYRLVLNKALFNCVNVLYMGILFNEDKRYKKYVNCSGVVYLVEC